MARPIKVELKTNSPHRSGFMPLPSASRATQRARNNSMITARVTITIIPTVRAMTTLPCMSSYLFLFIYFCSLYANDRNCHSDGCHGKTDGRNYVQRCRLLADEFPDINYSNNLEKHHGNDRHREVFTFLHHFQFSLRFVYLKST